MPPMLESYGLISTLNSYFERIKKLYNVEVIQNYPIKELNISSSNAYELYRIIQELTTNILKHSMSEKILFSIFYENNNLIFEIWDNGISFDFYKSSKETTGMGLKNIKSRLLDLRANLIQLPVEKGNKIQILLESNNNYQ